MDSQEISDTLKAAQTYLNRLKRLDNDLQSAVAQVVTTSREAELKIQETFSNLKSTIINILNQRERELLEEAKKIKDEAIKPLEECRCLIRKKHDSTNKFISTGQSLNGVSENLDNFVINASLLGSLPEVPQLTEVPYISFHYDCSNESEIKDVLSQFGEIYRMAPVQIKETYAKPGAVLVEWQYMECDDRMTDIQQFKLQRAFGNVVENKHLNVNFKDCYMGVDMHYLVKDLQPGQPYSFRVCCTFEGMTRWTPWSLPKVACTNLKPFSWESNTSYWTSFENKIAKPLGSNVGVLYSEGPQFLVGHSVEFTFLEVDSNPSDAMIGLVLKNVKDSLPSLKMLTEGVFMINRHGKIYIDGIEKATILPEFTKGLTIGFACDLTNKNKVRVNIDSNEKRVTYDWAINPDSEMYFAAQFLSTCWKIIVE